MYQGKHFSLMGDSISTLAGYNPPECAVYYDWERKRMAGIYAPEDTWWGTVIDALEGKLLVNNSYSGSTVTKHPACEVPSYGSSDERIHSLGMGAAPDVVMVFMGFNDWGSGVAPGKFQEAYILMLEKIQNAYPNAEIWCLTLPRGTVSRDPDREIPVLRAGRHIQEFNEIIRLCAQKAGSRVVELWNPSEPYDTMDGAHPNALGMQTIAQIVLRQAKGWWGL